MRYGVEGSLGRIRLPQVKGRDHRRGHRNQTFACDLEACEASSGARVCNASHPVLWGNGDGNREITHGICRLAHHPQCGRISAGDLEHRHRVTSGVDCDEHVALGLDGRLAENGVLGGGLVGHRIKACHTFAAGGSLTTHGDGTVLVDIQTNNYIVVFIGDEVDGLCRCRLCIERSGEYGREES